MNSSGEITVRQAKASDMTALQNFLEPFIGEGKLLRRNLREMESLLEQYKLAVCDEQIVGSVVLEVYSAKLAEIRSLAVSAQHQGRGIGKLLVQACLEEAGKIGVFEVMAITSQDAFFQSCGFDYTLPGEKKALFYLTRENM